MSTNAGINAMQNEWDEICCPICLEHPHNAVLLICTSYEKGCRSYLCDTSYRHSNCLDRFKKLTENHRNGAFYPGSLIDGNLENNNRIIDSNTSEPMVESDETHVDHEGINGGNLPEFDILNCPLCRGTVSGWMIVKETRRYLDLKRRSCSGELCAFSGNYTELRRHARRVHPTTRPADIDPSRQRAWRRMENRREYGDILSALRSTVPGGAMLGDYFVDDGNDMSRELDFAEGDEPWFATFLLLHMIGRSSMEQRGSPRPWRAHRRPYRQHTLWGRNLLGLQGEDYDDHLNPNDDIVLPRRRRRFERFTRDMNSSNDQ